MNDDNDNLFQTMAKLIAAGIDPASREEEIWQRYGETVAVLILDSSGFSRVSKSHGIVHFLARLMRIRETATSIFESHHSKNIHFEADNVFAVFPSVNDAIAGAMEIQEQIYAADLMLTDTERYQVGIGIGYGRMLYSETLEGYYSDEMNSASKLGENIANGGETLLTEAAYKTAESSLVSQFSRRTVEVGGLNLSYYEHRFNP